MRSNWWDYEFNFSTAQLRHCGSFHPQRGLSLTSVSYSPHAIQLTGTKNCILCYRKLMNPHGYCWHDVCIALKVICNTNRILRGKIPSSACYPEAGGEGAAGGVRYPITGCVMAARIIVTSCSPIRLCYLHVPRTPTDDVDACLKRLHPFSCLTCARQPLRSAYIGAYEHYRRLEPKAKARLCLRTRSNDDKEGG